MTRARQRQSVLWAAALMASGLVPVCGAGDEPSSSPMELRVFGTAAGGFRVAVPQAWHLQELPGAEVYQAFLSREKVEKKGDLYTYGLSVLRLRDYRKAFKLRATRPADVALEYATRVAAQLAGGQGGTVIGLPTGNHGLELTQYRVLGGQGPDCVSGTLLIGVSGTSWFHALWESPCSESEEPKRSAEILAMVESLYVEAKWGEEKK